MFTYLEYLVLGLASAMPLPLFAVVASFLEEVIAPIPSGAVLLGIGTLASLQGYPLLSLGVLALIATAGKTAGALVVYVIADKIEDFATSRFSRFLGVTHEELEQFGARLGNGWRDYVLLTALRAIPIVPSVVVSFGAGVLRIPLRLFITATVIGSFFRDLFFIVVGYLGLSAVLAFLEQSSAYESLVQYVVFGALVLGAVAYLLLRIRARAR